MLTAMIVLGAGIGLRDPWPSDEPRFALSARQMVDSGDENAINHSPPGGRIDIAVTSRNSATVLAVGDEGEGIPPEQREAMLQRFRRGESSNEGSGLGLAIVARIAEVHGAKVVLENSVKGGLCVAVAFPVDEEA